MYHIVQLATADDHVDGLRLEEVEGLRVASKPLLFHPQDYRSKHNNMNVSTLMAEDSKR